MVIWRISNYASLDGVGGLLAGGRWHTKGSPVVYCTLTPSTAVLETLVHLEIDPEDRPVRFQVLRIDAPDNLSVERIDQADLRDGWMEDLASTQSIGDAWLLSRRSALLEVPSVLVPETWNVLLNPMHPQASTLRVAAVYQHAFDVRFFR